MSLKLPELKIANKAVERKNIITFFKCNIG